jgi:serine protease AprX
MSVLDVWAQVDTLVEAGTGNLVGMAVYDPNGVRYGDTSIPFPVIGSDVREAVVNNPIPGTWRMEIRGASGLTAVQGVGSPQQLALPGPVEANVTQVKYILPSIPDIVGNPLQSQIEFALKNRLIDIYADGSFRPDQTVSREDMARSLVLNTPLRQTLGGSPKFSDVSGDLERIAEAVTSKGSTLRDYNFVPNSLMSSTGNLFNPAGTVNRLDLAVAFVRALGHDADARALAGSTVISGGTPLTDNGQIPSDLRGYVQIAINDGLFEAFPAEIRQIAPGQFQVIPGPRFEPTTTVSRATLAAKLGAFNALFTTGG